MTDVHADTLTFQQGDGGAFSETVSTTINIDTDIDFGVHFLLTVRSHDMQSLVRWPDIIGSSPGQIPPGSTIDAATLSVTMYNVAVPGEELGDSSIHEVYVPWQESMGGQDFYALAGPHYGPAEGMIPAHDLLEVAFGEMTSIVQHWADGDANRGIMLRNDVTPTQITRYYSDDAQDPSWRPLLTVNFTPPLVAVEPTTWGKVKALYR